MNVGVLILSGGTTPAPRRRRYLRGPIYWDWLQAAQKLPGASLAVGLVLWDYRALNKSLTFKAGIGNIAKFLGYSSDTVRRAIGELATAGLIKKTCTPGQKCVFTMVDIPPSKGRHAGDDGRDSRCPPLSMTNSVVQLSSGETNDQGACEVRPPLGENPEGGDVRAATAAGGAPAKHPK